MYSYNQTWGSAWHPHLYWFWHLVSSPRWSRPRITDPSVHRETRNIRKSSHALQPKNRVRNWLQPTQYPIRKLTLYPSSDMYSTVAPKTKTRTCTDPDICTDEPVLFPHHLAQIPKKHFCNFLSVSVSRTTYALNLLVAAVQFRKCPTTFQNNDSIHQVHTSSYQPVKSH